MAKKILFEEKAYFWTLYFIRNFREAFMSRYALYFCLFTILAVNCFYYPKWNKTGIEATISWDVSGYYMYLPAHFIYKDIKKCGFKDEILQKYKMTPNFQQAFIHEASGNYVMKYSIGQAVLFSPFFFVAHAWASMDSSYAADGFSFPYQFMISLWMMILTFIGLIFLRKSLLEYFDEWSVGLGLIGITLGSNYLNYVAIDGAMTHNTLFTIYSLLIYTTIQFYNKPTLKKSLGIGFLVGMAALIRPTEIISCLIPILWGVNIMKRESAFKRVQFMRQQWRNLLSAVVLTLAIGSIQFLYWKYASGDWVVYSYEDQGFSWLKPHIEEGLFSFRSGWLTYSPLMVFSLIGFAFLFMKDRSLFFTCFIFSMLFMYIAFAWDIWWYGGSLGQRAMVQAYPILIFPMCALAEKLIESRRKVAQVIVGGISVLFMYANLWFTHQCHLGGLVHVGSMTKAYYWQTLLTYEKDIEDKKLLDHIDRLYKGELRNTQIVYQDTAYKQVLNGQNQFGEKVIIPSDKISSSADWIRVSTNAFFDSKEWENWKMTQFIVQVKNGSDMVEDNMYRIQRVMEGAPETIYLDVRYPDEPFTSVEIFFWNAEGQKEINIQTLKVESFND